MGSEISGIAVGGRDYVAVRKKARGSSMALWFGKLWRRLPTVSLVSTEELKNAAAACEEADRRPRPPRETGVHMTGLLSESMAGP